MVNGLNQLESIRKTTSTTQKALVPQRKPPIHQYDSYFRILSTNIITYDLQDFSVQRKKPM